ncbi:hypothetical protein [Nitrobacter sp.]|uniref:hypothetical protein n=1 Tax=Nitrobacter sp. TaxID=29420 RepID=UPI0029CAAF63|nr:hypothetical protein [Nitrobacter sp.]
MFFVCLTGSIATVSEEIVWLVEPPARSNSSSPDAQKLSSEALLSKVIEQRPDAVVQSIAIPVKGIHAPQVSVGLPDGRNVIWTEPLFVELPTNHSLSKHSGVTWTDLMNETFLVRHGGTGPHLHDHIVQRFAGHGPAPSIQRFDVGHGRAGF